MSSMYGLVGMLAMPSAQGTAVPKPKKIKNTQALECPDCGCVWKSQPYRVEDEPLEHRLVCNDGWTPEYQIWTVTYWKGYAEAPKEGE